MGLSGILLRLCINCPQLWGLEVHRSKMPERSLHWWTPSRLMRSQGSRRVSTRCDLCFHLFPGISGSSFTARLVLPMTECILWRTHMGHTSQYQAKMYTYTHKCTWKGYGFYNFKISLIYSSNISLLHLLPFQTKWKEECRRLGRLFLLAVCRFFFMLRLCYIPSYADYSGEK